MNPDANKFEKISPKETSGWINKGMNHLSLKTWNMDDKELRQDLKNLLTKYPRLRLRVEAWPYKTTEEILKGETE